MNRPLATALAAMLFLGGCGSAGRPGRDLSGAAGNIYRVDPAGRSFRFLTETAYDPETGAGTSWYTVHWTDATEITEVAELKSFAGVEAPVLADFHGIDDANAAALAAGRPFVARVAVLMPDAKVPVGVSENARQVTGYFTPGTGKAPRGGTIEIAGKPVKVTLRRSHWRIYIHRKLPPEVLARGFWKATVHGRNTDGRFVTDKMEVSPLDDPRTTDDPALPRVLVVGDSISMNYHDAAKAALAGVANYHRIEGNSFSTVFGVANMRRWLGDYETTGLHWDVIQFNHGLHDLKQPYDAATGTWGPYAVSLDDYKANLEKEIAILKKTGATLIWCSTTPVPNDNTGQYARRKGAAREFNAAAMDVMRRDPEIRINDLHGFIGGNKAFDTWRTGSDVHFWNADLQALVGKAVAEVVRKAIDARNAAGHPGPKAGE